MPTGMQDKVFQTCFAGQCFPNLMQRMTVGASAYCFEPIIVWLGICHNKSEYSTSMRDTQWGPWITYTKCRPNRPNTPKITAKLRTLFIDLPPVRHNNAEYGSSLISAVGTGRIRQQASENYRNPNTKYRTTNGFWYHCTLYILVHALCDGALIIDAPADSGKNMHRVCSFCRPMGQWNTRKKVFTTITVILHATRRLSPWVVSSWYSPCLLRCSSTIIAWIPTRRHQHPLAPNTIHRVFNTSKPCRTFSPYGMFHLVHLSSLCFIIQ